MATPTAAADMSMHVADNSSEAAVSKPSTSDFSDFAATPSGQLVSPATLAETPTENNDLEYPGAQVLSTSSPQGLPGTPSAAKGQQGTASSTRKSAPSRKKVSSRGKAPPGNDIDEKLGHPQGQGGDESFKPDVDMFFYKLGPDENKPPLSNIEDVFADMVGKGLDLGLEAAIKHLRGRKLVVATMCSGTESPILALRLICDVLQKRGLNLNIYHSFSAEIVAYKQAYIERNFAPPIIFRDVREFSVSGATEGTTAYGGLVKIPENVDILVAGFSCVDFSNLNTLRQSLDAGGESGDTFRGVFNYVQQFSPTIVILENVIGAPWKQFVEDWAKIGYTATLCKADTKDYYIPHTRQRGYMLCVENSSFLNDCAGQPDVGLKWKDLMKKFERRASCSFEEFLLDESDPRVIQAMEELSIKRGRATHKVGWTSSNGRHQDYRASLLLGQKRPLTNWQDGGSCKATDQMWQGWIRRQVERVWDAIDISFLRCLKRGFDFQYKSRLLDLSQNVDRNTDRVPAGVANCVTPNGIPFSTVRGGPLIGLETLALQGIPIDRLQLTQEKQAQLQDLAGNAMTSTVVGSAILSALIASFFGLSQGSPNSTSISTPAPLSKVVGEHFLSSFSLNLDKYKPIGVQEAKEKAEQSVRLCLCEGRKADTKIAIQQCLLCMHTSCTKCGGNPVHHYEPISKNASSQRILPEIFTSFIKKGIPMRLQFAGIGKKEIYETGWSNEAALDSTSWELSIKNILNAFGSELLFHSTKRAGFWSVCYESEYARMELVIMSDNLEWRLYAKPSPTSAVNSLIRKLLAQPIARMRPTGNDLTRGPWQLWLPKQEIFFINVAPQGDLTPSFESLQGIEKFDGDMVWARYEVSIVEPVASVVPSTIVGSYVLLQDCGMASGSLHAQEETIHLKNRIFFFLDPHRLHEASNDSFIFSSENRRLDFGEKRQVLATLDPSWRPPILQKINQTGGDQSLNYRVKGTHTALSKAEAQTPVRVKCVVDGGWTDLPTARFGGPKMEMDMFSCVPADFALSSDSVMCNKAHAVFSCKTSIPSNLCTDWKRGEWFEISHIEEKKFYKSFAWIIEKACRLKGLDEWRRMSRISGACSKCAPIAPRIKWRIEAPKTPTTKIKPGMPNTVASVIDGTSVEKRLLLLHMEPSGRKEHSAGAAAEQIEDELVDEAVSPEEMEYLAPPEETRHLEEEEVPDDAEDLREVNTEEKIKSPDKLEPKSRSRILKLVPFEEPSEAADFELQLKSRPQSLVAQVLIDESGMMHLKLAFNPVTLMHRALARLSTGQGAEEVSWRLVTDHKSATKFSLPQFEIPCNMQDPSAKTPSRFVVNLRPEQLRSLWWMIQRESNESEDFVEEEVEEVVVPELQWRGEGRATKTVVVKGGVLADEVGYGKTATTLALIESQRKQDQLLAENSSKKGYISLKATLILVPAQLPQQWLGEIHKFLGVRNGRNVMVLKTFQSMQKKTISDFQNADIIIASWRFFEGDGYLSKVAQFSGMVELPSSASARAASAWYGQAVREIAQHVENLKSGGTTLNDLLMSKLQENEEEAANAETFIPSRRFRGKAYHTQKKNAANSAKRGHEMITPDNDVDIREPRKDVFGLEDIATGKKNWTAMKCPLLEVFEFARVIIDEYTYVHGRQNLTVLGLKANHRWILSATPPLQDFADIKRIAQYLGINLGIDDVTPGVISASNIQALERDRTDSERFHSYRVNPSVAWHDSRVRVAQRFLDQFVRRNIPDIEAVPSDTHILPVRLPAPERAIYLELNQILVANDFSIRHFFANASGARTRRVRDLFQESATATEVLVKSASQFNIERLDNKMEDPHQVCDAIAQVRSDQRDHTVKEIEKTVKKSEWLNSECITPTTNYAAWKAQINDNYFGDSGVMTCIQSIIAAAEADLKDDDWKEFFVTAKELADRGKRAAAARPNKRRKLTHDDPGSELKEGEVQSLDERPLKPEGIIAGKNMEEAALALRQASNRLRELSTELVSRTRCLRFFQSIRELHVVHTDMPTSPSPPERYTCPKCEKTSESDEKIWILTQCGHQMCNSCREELGGQGRDECLYDGCRAINRPYQLITAEELRVEDETPRTSLNYGKKIESIVNLIHHIPCEDQILVFVQFPSLAEKLMAAFDDGEISYSNLAGVGDAGARLTAFQADSKKERRKQVLILNIGDESAAGSNLTNANHIIFVSPYVTDSQQRYDHARTQAIGRARRFGQQKRVHIYDFVALKTIDVDILQMRNQRVLKMKEQVSFVEPAHHSPHLPFPDFVPSAFELVERQWGNTNTWGEFGSFEASTLLANTEDF